MDVNAPLHVLWPIYISLSLSNAIRSSTLAGQWPWLCFLKPVNWYRALDSIEFPEEAFACSSLLLLADFGYIESVKPRTGMWTFHVFILLEFFLTWILFPFNVWRSWKLIKRNKKWNYGFFWRIRIRIKLADITGHLVLFSPFNIDQNKVGLFQAWMSVFNGSPSPRLLPIHSMATLPAML